MSNARDVSNRLAALTRAEQIEDAASALIDLLFATGAASPDDEEVQRLHQALLLTPDAPPPR